MPVREKCFLVKERGRQKFVLGKERAVHSPLTTSPLHCVMEYRTPRRGVPADHQSDIADSDV